MKRKKQRTNILKLSLSLPVQQESETLLSWCSMHNTNCFNELSEKNRKYLLRSYQIRLTSLGRTWIVVQDMFQTSLPTSASNKSLSARIRFSNYSMKDFEGFSYIAKIWPVKMTVTNDYKLSLFVLQIMQAMDEWD